MRLALFQPDIPQNLGAALRLGACLEVPIDVIEPCGFPLSDRAVARAALDYGERAQIIRHSGWADFLKAREQSGGRLLLFTTRGPQTFDAFAYRDDDILLFGRESAGVPEPVRDAADVCLTIPMARGARSLNVVTAAALALGVALRQTNGFPRPATTG